MRWRKAEDVHGDGGGDGALERLVMSLWRLYGCNVILGCQGMQEMHMKALMCAQINLLGCGWLGLVGTTTFWIRETSQLAFAINTMSEDQTYFAVYELAQCWKDARTREETFREVEFIDWMWELELLRGWDHFEKYALKRDEEEAMIEDVQEDAAGTNVSEVQEETEVNGVWGAGWTELRDLHTDEEAATGMMCSLYHKGGDVIRTTTQQFERVMCMMTWVMCEVCVNLYVRMWQYVVVVVLVVGIMCDRIQRGSNVTKAMMQWLGREMCMKMWVICEVCADLYVRLLQYALVVGEMWRDVEEEDA